MSDSVPQPTSESTGLVGDLILAKHTALKNLGHRVARSTLAEIVKEQGIPPSGARVDVMADISASTRCAIVAADFFTTDVWTARGLTTFCTVFVIELHSRRVPIAGSTPHPDEAFVLQIVRHLTAPNEGLLGRHRVFLCDRDRKWSLAVRQLLEDSGVQVIQTPSRAPTCNSHADRFVRSIKEECLDRIIPLGEQHFRRALAEYMVHYKLRMRASRPRE